jgi:tetratricopeptide (TPR) repeat protein
MTPRILWRQCAVRVGWRVAGSVALAGALACGAMAWRTGAAHASGDTPSAAPSQGAVDREIYTQQAAAHYNLRFGADSPFLPSNATTDTGQFIDPKSFISAKYCGHCHQETYAQWRQTAHANSFRPPWYVKNTNLLRNEKGIEFTRHCEGCHNPTALVSGALTKGSPVDRHFDQDGITCTVCHSIQKVDQHGTGSYVIAQPAALVDANGNPIYGEVPDKEILAHLDRHSKAVMKDFYRTSEFCGACHKAAIPRTLNGYKWQRAIFLSDEWQQSSFAKESPLPFYVKPTVSTCQTCHMPSESITLPDYGAEQGKLASHRWLGANTLIPKYYGYDEQMQKVIAFLRNGVLNVDLFAVERNGGPVIAPLGSVPVTLAAGDDLLVSVVIQNKGIAHSLVPEQRDFYECWVEFQAQDGAGHAIMDSGAIGPDGALDPGAHSFTNRLINVRGTLNDLHQVWDTRVIAYNNTIASGRSQIVRYEFKVPADATGPITLTAKVNYRRFNQHFIDFGMGKHYEQPVVEMASRTRKLALGENPAEKPDAQDNAGQDNPDWMRWNNYGIGLLDAQQYAASVYAFERVAALRPDYADAYTNVAISDISWQRYDAARASLEKALALAPKNARALYYRALVERIQGNLDAAVADLREVAAQFPRSRDAVRELGFSLYQQHKYADATAEYQMLQGIDPDDLAGHYMLSILYRRLGRKDDAAREAAIFADEKDDPTANSYALDWLAKHPEITAESVPWHVHRQPAPAGSPVAENKESGQ